MPHQKLLGFGFPFGGPYSHPDQKSVRFRELLQSSRTLALQPSSRPKHRRAARNEPRQNRQDADEDRPQVFHHKKERHSEGGGATGDAADDGGREFHIVFAQKRAPRRGRQTGKIWERDRAVTQPPLQLVE